MGCGAAWRASPREGKGLWQGTMAGGTGTETLRGVPGGDREAVAPARDPSRDDPVSSGKRIRRIPAKEMPPVRNTPKWLQGAFEVAMKGPGSAREDGRQARRTGRAD